MDQKPAFLEIARALADRAAPAHTLDVQPYVPYVPTDHTLADTMYDRLAEQMTRFQADLADDEEVGASLTHFGKDVTISIESLGYHNPGLIIFYGTTADGHRVRLLQHLTQVNVLLIAMKVKPGTKARRIGFEPRDSDSEQE